MAMSHNGNKSLKTLRITPKKARLRPGLFLIATATAGIAARAAV